MAIRKGVVQPFDVRGMRSAMGVSTDVLGVVLDTSSKTVERWEKAGIPEATPVYTLESLHRLQELCDLGVTVYGDRFKEFLRTPMRALGGKAPWRMLVAGDLDKVFELLVASYEGDGF